jgi:hypothetical protein
MGLQTQRAKTFGPGRGRESQKQTEGLNGGQILSRSLPRKGMSLMERMPDSGHKNCISQISPAVAVCALDVTNATTQSFPASADTFSSTVTLG